MWVKCLQTGLPSWDLHLSRLLFARNESWILFCRLILPYDIPGPWRSLFLLDITYIFAVPRTTRVHQSHSNLNLEFKELYKQHVKAIEKVLKYRFFFLFLFVFFLLFSGMGGEEGTFIEGQCGVDATPHRLRSSVLAGRDNYTTAWNKVCAEADGFLRYTLCRAIWPAKPSALRDKEQWRSIILQCHCKYMHVFIWTTVQSAWKQNLCTLFHTCTRKST